MTALIFIVVGLYYIPTMASPTVADQAQTAAALKNFSVALFKVFTLISVVLRKTLLY